MKKSLSFLLVLKFLILGFVIINLPGCYTNDIDSSITSDEYSDDSFDENSSASSDENTSKWLQGAGPLRGHEDITRFGVDMANSLITAKLHIASFYPAVLYGDSGMFTINQIVKGNYCTDNPNKAILSFYGLPLDMSSSDYQNDSMLMSLHSLRNYTSSTDIDTAYEACVEIKQKIMNITRKAMEAFKTGDTTMGMFWVGHGSHIIQDSFSPAHALRSGTGLKNIYDVCTYGMKVSGVCYHNTIELDNDRIWKNTFYCQTVAPRCWDCMKPEAQAASKATAGYLYTLARLVSGDSVNVEIAINAYFEGDVTFPVNSGFFKCDQLSH